MAGDTNIHISQDYSSKLVNPKTYASDELHDIYTDLRANNPLGVAKAEGFDPFWVVTKYEDVYNISKNNTLFPYGDRPSSLMDKIGSDRGEQLAITEMVYTLIQMDEPMHMKCRLLTQAWFNPGNVKKREEEIREIARKSRANMEAMGGKGDFVASVALNFPLEVIMNILGVPDKDFPFMLRLTQEIFGPLDPDVQQAMNAMSIEDISNIQHAVLGELIQYFEQITEDRRANPTDDLASVVANATLDGEPIPDNVLNGYYLITATAGHDTTSSSTSMGMWALATQPGLLERLQNDPSLIPAFVEECIRWATPVKNFMRTASEDVEIRGRTVKKGDWIMLCYASANRDEEVFDEPFAFSIDRSPNKHIAFGYGPHLCLGAHLARMEMRILFEELLPMIKSVRLAGEPRLSESYFVNGLKTLPIEFALNA